MILKALFHRMRVPVPVVLSILILANISYAAEFEIDEIITAIKNEIKTANISELGNPIFRIESVDVSLTVVSSVTAKGALAVKILGYDNETSNEILSSNSVHTLRFNFKPVGASSYSPEISIGLVEPIMKIKDSLRKAYNSPPDYQMGGFTFRLEFAIEKSMDSGIRFTVIELNDLKARNNRTPFPAYSGTSSVIRNAHKQTTDMRG